MKKTLLSSIILTLFTLNSPILLADSEPSNQVKTTAVEISTIATKKTNPIHLTTWLGVGLKNISPDLANHFSSVLNGGQGVMVESVANKSPAAKAGVKKYDILVNFDQQKLFSSRQLSQLVKSSKADQKVNLKLLRNGQIENIAVTLASHATVTHQIHKQYPQMQALGFYRPNWQLNSMPPAMKNLPNQHPSYWSEFESIQLKSIGDNKYHAEIEIQSANGKNKKFTFEGTKEQLNKQIKENNELTENNKNTLINTLSLRNINPFNNNFPFSHQFGVFPGFPAY